jgi:hypothetical protein
MSYLFILVRRDGSDVFSLRELPPAFRVSASKLPVGGTLAVPSGTLYSVDAGKDIPPGDFAALCEAEV